MTHNTAIISAKRSRRIARSGLFALMCAGALLLAGCGADETAGEAYKKFLV